MSIVVVRCPRCKQPSRVGPEAVGVVVVCPVCQSPFLAVEDAAPVAPPRPRSTRAAEPVAPPSAPAPLRPRRRAEPISPPSSAPRAELHESEHGLGGGLPATVLVGLALLPFLIPLLWVLAPAVLGQTPVLSIAAPTALAIAASALCLAVVYTVDWTPATRVKGVLMLVGLSYFAAASLFYLKKEMLDRVKRFFGAGAEWKEFRAPAGDYRIQMPGRVSPLKIPLMPGWALQSHQAVHKSYLGLFGYNVGFGPDAHPKLPDEAWFAAARQAVTQADQRRKVVDERAVAHQQWPGREWVIESADEDATVSIVRVYRVRGRTYYVSARGPKLSPDDDETKAYFDSFHVTLPDPKDD